MAEKCLPHTMMGKHNSIHFFYYSMQELNIKNNNGKLNRKKLHAEVNYSQKRTWVFFNCTILISDHWLSLVEHKIDINQSIILFFHFYCTLTLLAIQQLELLGIKPAQFP